MIITIVIIVVIIDIIYIYIYVIIGIYCTSFGGSVFSTSESFCSLSHVIADGRISSPASVARTCSLILSLFYNEVEAELLLATSLLLLDEW